MIPEVFMAELNFNQIYAFKKHLLESERSSATIEKYIRDISAFYSWLNAQEPDKEAVLKYKSYLCEKYAPSSVNSMLSSLNAFWNFCGLSHLKVKNLKIQRKIFASYEKELCKAEYMRLLNTAKAKKNERLYLLMQTICSTGIRISELKFISVEAVASGIADINCKGKQRRIFIPTELRKILRKYIQKHKIKKGPVFITKNGKPMDRSNIWSDMKKLCSEAKVSKEKVFPHNLRHLFARTFYNVKKDIFRLADILGHSSVNTTRIYTMETGEIHRRQIEHLGLLLC